jgi:FkbM family methyltransferase
MNHPSLGNLARQEPRPESDDGDIWRSVVMWNKYRLPSCLEAGDVVVDIGAHIGAFAYLALLRGAGVVYAFEADGENFGIALRNLGWFGLRASVKHLAVWHTENPPEPLYFHGYPRVGGVWKTGEGTVGPAPRGQRVRVISLEGALRLACKGGRKRIRIAKLSCDAALWYALARSPLLASVNELVGEYSSASPSNAVGLRVASGGGSKAGGMKNLDLVGILQRRGFEADVIEATASDPARIFARQAGGARSKHSGDNDRHTGLAPYQCPCITRESQDGSIPDNHRH